MDTGRADADQCDDDPGVLGVCSGAVQLGETLRWQDWTAVVLMVSAIALVVMKR